MNQSQFEDCGLLLIKQTDGTGLCLEDQYEALQISRKNCQLPGKMSVIKTAGKKCPFKTVALAVKL